MSLMGDERVGAGPDPGRSFKVEPSPPMGDERIGTVPHPSRWFKVEPSGPWRRASRILQWTGPADSLAGSVSESGRDPDSDGLPPRPLPDSSRIAIEIRMRTASATSTAGFVSRSDRDPDGVARAGFRCRIRLAGTAPAPDGPRPARGTPRSRRRTTDLPGVRPEAPHPPAQRGGLAIGLRPGAPMQPGQAPALLSRAAPNA